MDRTFIRKVLFVFATGVIVLLTWKLASVLLLAFGAVIIAVLLRSLADPIRDRTPLNDGMSLLAAGLLIGLVLLGAGWLFGSTISNQVGELSRTLPQSIAEVQERIARAPLGEELLAQLDRSDGVASRLGGLFGQLGSLVMGLATAATELLLVIFAGLYFALNPSRNRDGLLLLVPPGPREGVRQAMDASGRALKLWLLGTVASMVVVGVLTGLGALLIGLPSPLALGLFAGLAAFVPIIGPILSVVPGVLLALLQGPEMVLWTLLMYFAVQQIESNLSYPLIQRRTVDLPPSLTLFGVLAFGALLGPLGVVFATPLVVVLFVSVKMLYLQDTLGEETTVPGETEPDRPAG